MTANLQPGSASIVRTRLCSVCQSRIAWKTIVGIKCAVGGPQTVDKFVLGTYKVKARRKIKEEGVREEVSAEDRDLSQRLAVTGH